MKREIIIKKAMLKLNQTEMTQKNLLIDFVRDLKRIYQKYSKGDNFNNLDFPKEILRYLGNKIMDRYNLSQKDKLFFLNEVKKNKLFNFNLNKNLERAWRTILKKWDLSNYRLEGGL